MLWASLPFARATVAFFFSLIIAKISAVKLIFFEPKTMWRCGVAGSGEFTSFG
jgi:hypothetical protein